jgi:outer membrane lipoprotein carrier protein
MKYLLFFATISFSFIGISQDYKMVSDKSPVKAEIEKKHKETNSIIADFSEKVHSDMFKEPQSGNGKLYFKKENKVRWEHTSAKQLILINGDNVKLYEDGKLVSNPASQKVVKQIQGMMISMLSGDFLNEKEFSITYQENTKYYRLSLTPKNPRMAKHLTKIELRFSKSSLLLDEMTMIEKGNQKIIYTFTNLKTNQTIVDSKFNTL